MSEFVTHFHFIRPWWFVALIPCALLCFYLIYQYRKSSQWTNLIDETLLPFLIDGEFSKTQKFPIYGMLLLWVLGTIALAGPTWEKQPQPVQVENSAMVILWDLSPSMDAQDIKPSRLVRSRLKLEDLLNERKEGQTALIVYAGDAHVVTPLTEDIKTIKNMLPGLNPNVLPARGSVPERAFELAHQLLEDTGINKGDIVFVTDGISHDAINSLWATAADSKHRVTVWGFGTEEGAPIPLPRGGFAKSKRGEIVVAKLDHEALSHAAVKMNGVYIPFTTDNSDIESIMHFGFDASGSRLTENEKLADEWLEQGHWLVILMIPFAALAFRRGWLLSVCLAVFISPDSHAFGWQDLWKTKDQQAQTLLQQDNPQEASTLFKDPQWKAIADYKAGNYGEAQSHFEKNDDANAKYNSANSLTQQGEYDKAIAAYNEALELQPDFAEAEHNKRIAEQLKALEEQQNQQQNNEENNQDQQNQENNDQSSAEGENQQDQQKDSGQDQQSQEDQQADNQQNSESNSPQEGSDEEQQQDQSTSESQQEALDKHYQQAQQNASQESQDEQQQREQSEGRQENETGEDAEQLATAVEMSDEEKEQQQALEQWLRRVPDDPSGLLRNKFRYEYNKRRRENYEQRLRSRESGEPDERW